MKKAAPLKMPPFVIVRIRGTKALTWQVCDPPRLFWLAPAAPPRPAGVDPAGRRRRRACPAVVGCSCRAIERQHFARLIDLVRCRVFHSEAFHAALATFTGHAPGAV